MFNDGNGDLVVRGVEFEYEGHTYTVDVKKEAVISAGYVSLVLSILSAFR